MIEISSRNFSFCSFNTPISSSNFPFFTANTSISSSSFLFSVRSKSFCSSNKLGDFLLADFGAEGEGSENRLQEADEDSEDVGGPFSISKYFKWIFCVTKLSIPWYFSKSAINNAKMSNKFTHLQNQNHFRDPAKMVYPQVIQAPLAQLALVKRA